MDRRQAHVGKAAQLDREESARWASAPIEEKLRAITFLRECFYGPEATTGRLQRVHRVLERA
jgi:hypothetical protein